MADKKFSQFEEQTDPSNVQFVAGYSGSNNVKISPANLTDLTGYLLNTTDTFTGDLTVTGTIDATGDISVNGLTVGKGGTSNAANTAIGVNSLLDVTTGNGNTAIGSNAGSNITTGESNTAIGRSSLRDATIANNNTAIGVDTLTVNLDGSSNTAVGHRSLYLAAGATENTAVGKNSLTDVTTGNGNTAVGYNAGANTTTGESNTAVGYQSLFGNLDGRFNVGLGFNALNLNTTGDSNVALGKQSLYAIVGDENIGIGKDAGRFALVGNKEIGSRNIFIGADTKSALSGSTLNEIVIGDGATGNGSNTVTLGNDSITDTYLKGDVTITGNVLADGVTRYIDTEISSAQILDLHNTPVYTLPQPTNGEIYVVDRVLLRYSFGTISYAPSSMQIKYAYYTDGVKADEATNTIFVSEGVPQFTRLGINGNPVPISQSGIALYTDSAITLGDGTMKARTYYSVIPSTF